MARILLAEDNDLNRRLFRDILTGAGYEVESVVDGAAALSAIDARMPDLVLLDLQLPVRSGHDVVRAIRRNPALQHMPVIAVSAFANRADMEKAKQNGFTDFIGKPAPVDDILAIVATHLAPICLPRTAS